jgi:hypothetical protein
MKKLHLLAVLAVPLLPLMATPQSAFDGTWKIDLSKVEFPTKPQVFLLQNGMYHCQTCVPPVEIKADGEDQKVTGHPYYNTAAIKVVSDHEVQEIDKKDGKTVSTSKMVISPDGNTMTTEFSDSTSTNAEPVTGKGEAVRVAKGPAGSNAISGSWRTTKMENMSDNGLMWTYKLSGDELSMTSPTGQSYTAKLDGTETAYKGDPGVSSVSVKSMGKDMLEETDKRDGKVISVTKMTVGPDGKTMSIVSADKLHGTTSHFVATKE